MQLSRTLGLVIAGCLVGWGCGGDDDGDGGDGNSADAAPVVDGAPAVDAAPVADSAPSADSAAPLACGDTGSAIVDGVVGDVSLSPVARAFLIPLDTNGYIVVISTDEAEDVCDETDSGNSIAIITCDAEAVGSLSVGDPETFDCPGGAGSVLEDETGGDLADSSSGTFEITSVSDDCVTGDFDITYGADGSYSGSFAAVVCPPSA